MHGLILLPLLSVLVGLAFFAVVVAVVRGDHTAALSRYGGAVQLATTSVLLVTFAAAGGSGAEMFHGPALLSLEHVGWIAAGFVGGAACFGAELVTAHAWDLLGGRSARARRIGEGGSRGLLRCDVRSPMFVVVGVGLAVAEELLWRQLAIGVLVREHWTPAPAAAVTAILFGMNHYWFGARNVVAKAIDGGAWGALLLVSGTVTAAIAAHLAFQWFVVRRLAAQQSMAPFDLRGGDRAGVR